VGTLLTLGFASNAEALTFSELYELNDDQQVGYLLGVFDSEIIIAGSDGEINMDYSNCVSGWIKSQEGYREFATEMNEIATGENSWAFSDLNAAAVIKLILAKHCAPKPSP